MIWADYKRGFGNLNGEFWLGLDKMHRLTKEGRNRIRVELEDTEGNTAYADYDMFAVASERAKYQLSLGTYSGEGVKLNKTPLLNLGCHLQLDINSRLSLEWLIRDI